MGLVTIYLLKERNFYFFQNLSLRDKKEMKREKKRKILHLPSKSVLAKVHINHIPQAKFFTRWLTRPKIIADASFARLICTHIKNTELIKVYSLIWCNSSFSINFYFGHASRNRWLKTIIVSLNRIDNFMWIFF